MTPDLVVPILASLAWLILAGSALASFRLGWSKVLKMALVWLAIFGGAYIIVVWFEAAASPAASLAFI